MMEKEENVAGKKKKVQLQDLGVSSTAESRGHIHLYVKLQEGRPPSRRLTTALTHCSTACGLIIILQGRNCERRYGQTERAGSRGGWSHFTEGCIHYYLQLHTIINSMKSINALQNKDFLMNCLMFLGIQD